MKAALLLSFVLGMTFTTHARSSHSRLAPGHHGHQHHRAYLTTREQQKPLHRERK